MSVCDLGDDVLSAVGKGDVSGVKNLISKHKNELNGFINKREAKSGQTPLMKSVLMGHTEIVKTLLELDEVDVTIGEKDGYTPMHGAGFQVGNYLSYEIIDPSIAMHFCALDFFVGVGSI